MKTRSIVSFAIAGIISMSCKKTDPLPTFDSLENFYASNQTEGTSYTVNVSASADTIVTNRGTQFIFPQGSFSVAGDVTLKIKETTEPSAFIITNSPNAIDSTFNQNPVVFDIKAEGATFNPSNTFKVKFANKGVLYSKVSCNSTAWAYVNSVTTSTQEPNAGDAPTVYSNATNTSFTYNKLGEFATSKNPFIGAKTKAKIKIFGFTNDVLIQTFVVSQGNNAVSVAKRISDNEFISDSVSIGAKLQFVALSFNQKTKYVGLANTILNDTLPISISLHVVSSQEALKSEITDYFK